VGSGGGASLPRPWLAGPFQRAEAIGVGGAGAFAVRADSRGVEEAGPEERVRVAEGDPSHGSVLEGAERIGRFGAVPVDGGKGRGGEAESGGALGGLPGSEGGTGPAGAASERCIP